MTAVVYFLGGSMGFLFLAYGIRCAIKPKESHIVRRGGVQ